MNKTRLALAVLLLAASLPLRAQNAPPALPPATFEPLKGVERKATDEGCASPFSTANSPSLPSPNAAQNQTVLNRKLRPNTMLAVIRTP